jgi:hypothetical protein
MCAETYLEQPVELLEAPPVDALPQEPRPAPPRLPGANSSQAPPAYQAPEILETASRPAPFFGAHGFSSGDDVGAVAAVAIELPAKSTANPQLEQLKKSVRAGHESASATRK